jgi:hypothetical protein
VVLYKRGHHIEPKGYFIVEISSELSTLFITAFSAVGPESFVLIYKNKDSYDILHTFGNDCNLMAMCLTFKNERLVIRNPKNLFK